MGVVFADLHTHTTCSDGSFSPAELIDQAHRLGLQALSITDHDTLGAYKEAIPLAQAAGLLLLPGVELSSLCGKTSVHILAYGFSLENPLIVEMCDAHLKHRRTRCLEIIELLGKHKVFLQEDAFLQEALAMHKLVGRPHIGAAMVRQGYVGSMEEAFQRYLGEDCPCYRSAISLSPEETIDAIHQAKGLAVLAHPHLISNEALLQKLLKMPFDGIETYYARFSAHRNHRFLQIAQHKKWISTGGSDFHGTVKPHISLGCSWTPQETFEELFQHYQKVIEVPL